MKDIIESHIRAGLLASTIGTPPDDLRPAIVVWAKHPPRIDTEAMVAIAKMASGRPPLVFVDDVASRIHCSRTLSEQQAINELHRASLASMNCDVRFSSIVLESRPDYMELLRGMASRITVRRFVHCLPQRKAMTLRNLSTAEIFNMLSQLLVFEQTALEANVLVVRHSTQAIVMAHREVSTKRLAAMVLPPLPTAEDACRYVQRASLVEPFPAERDSSD